MRLDVQFHRLIAGEISVHLTGSEFRLICAMAQGRVATADELVYAMHGDDESESSDSLAKVVVSKVRRKFRGAGLGPVIITVWGRGYRLMEPIAVTHAAIPVMIPAEHRAVLERLLYSHPDHAAADRVLASFVGG